MTELFLAFVWAVAAWAVSNHAIALLLLIGTCLAGAALGVKLLRPVRLSETQVVYPRLFGTITEPRSEWPTVQPFWYANYGGGYVVSSHRTPSAWEAPWSTVGERREFAQGLRDQIRHAG